MLKGISAIVIVSNRIRIGDISFTIHIPSSREWAGGFAFIYGFGPVLKYDNKKKVSKMIDGKIIEITNPNY